MEYPQLVGAVVAIWLRLIFRRTQLVCFSAEIRKNRSGLFLVKTAGFRCSMRRRQEICTEISECYCMSVIISVLAEAGHNRQNLGEAVSMGLGQLDADT